MRSHISIKTRLLTVTFILGGLAIVLAIGGLFGMRSSNEAIRIAHDKQLAGAIALSNTESFIARQRTSLDQAALRPGSDNARYMFQREQEVRAVAMKAWQDFLALPRDATEEQMTQEVTRLMGLTENDIDHFKQVIQADDSEQIVKVAVDVGKSYTLMQAASVKLKAYQAQAAQNLYDAAQSRYTLFIWLSVAAVVLTLLVIGYCQWTIQSAIAKPLARVLAHFRVMAKGDLSQPIHVHSSDEMGQLLEGLSTMRDGLVTTVGTVRTGSHAIAAATDEIAAGNMDLSSRTEEQASALQETAASMEELSGTVSQNAENAEHANRLATSAAEIAGKGSQMVSTMVTTMEDINDSSAKVADITTLIEGIAFQTNILALNAAVEAARAGEQGRGFAVVAGEVRSLAQRSSAAASEIKKLITESVDRAQRGSEQARDTGKTISEVNVAVERVAKLIAEISAASGEQRRGIEQVSHAVTQMDAVTQQNAALVEQASATAQALNDQARALNTSVSVFTL